MDEELLDGFHVETLPQFNTDDRPSEDAMSWVAGMRAVWMLYQRQEWDKLSTLGIVRTAVEERLAKLSYNERLTTKQAVWLARRVPEMESAALRLRFKYALKFRMQEVANGGIHSGSPGSEE